MNLEEFTAMEVIEDVIWREWCGVRDTPTPDDRWLPPEEHAKRDPALRGFTYVGPSPAYERKSILKQQINTSIREALRQDCWKITGRINGRHPRVDIEYRDVLSSDIRLADNRIGHYHDVEISRIAVSPQSFLQSQIEAFCKRVSPGEPLKKEVIGTILGSLFPDKVSNDHFLAAWNDAHIGPEWKKPGRRPGTKKNDS